MSGTAAPTAPLPSSAQSSPADLCACGHRLDAHDAISARFCAATIVNNLLRGCVCPKAAG